MTSDPKDTKPPRKHNDFRDKVLERLVHDEDREIEDIRSEEHNRMSTNMFLSVGFTVLFTIWAVIQGESLLTIASQAKSFVTRNLSWFFILLATGSLIYLMYLAFSRFGDVVLGDPEDQPEFSDLSWYSMLFSAGMGVGLLFWGGAEPVIHFLHPPVGNPATVEAARQAMGITLFHWGLHGWGVYTLCAVAVAYYGFRKRKKYLVSSAVVDLFASPTLNKGLKLVADLTATLAIIFGVAASVGMGTYQLAAGFSHAYGWTAAKSGVGYAVILVLVTIAFIASATTGLKKGIQILSNVNMGMCIALMLFVFLCGPTLFILKLFVDSLGQYLSALPSLGFRVAPFTPAYEHWMADWTLTYFTWWIAWAPFVGIFIARISRGRTIKELILGSLAVPTLFTVAWFSVFGGTGLWYEMNTNEGIGHLVAGPNGDPAVGLFALLGHLPLSGVTSTLSLCLLFTFLVTSADSATFVIAMMTTEGDLEPRLGTKVMWGTLLATVTGILVSQGSIEPIQAAALSSAFPYSLVLILMALAVPIRLAHQVAKRRL
ncbi:MAG: BCCT family transporter [Candidatus Eremiobacteraeota bacterium]|nr:BCCT family transporter [Candidatus Eremiobacteraeota bacterium]